MAKAGRKNQQPPSLLLVEGETDEIFYERIKKDYLKDCRVIIHDLKGLFNVNKKVVNKIVSASQKNKGTGFRIYCCLDRESRDGRTPGFDMNVIKKQIKDRNIKGLISIDAIITTQQIESWFFYDITNIYKFLKVPKAKRKANAFSPPEKYTYKDFQRLFERYGKTYNKGKRAANFIEHLDINNIVSNCKELNDGIEKIKKQSCSHTHKD